MSQNITFVTLCHVLYDIFWYQKQNDMKYHIFVMKCHVLNNGLEYENEMFVIETYLKTFF